MKKGMLVGAVCAVVVAGVSGCGLRYGATEAQRENAWMHARVCAAAAQTAVEEEASARLCALTALAGLLGGVYGVRTARFLQEARDRARALREIVAGNELFKQLYPEQAERFKEAQGRQSAETKKIVTELK